MCSKICGLMAAVFVGMAAFAADVEVADGGATTVDLQGAGNVATDRIVFAGGGTLTLTNTGDGENVFRPQVIAATAGKTVTIEAGDGVRLRLANHVSVKGTLATGGAAVSFGDTAVTPQTLDDATAVVAAFPMLDVGAVSGAIAVDGAAQLTKKVEGIQLAETAFVALAGAKALGEGDVTLGCNAMVVNPEAVAPKATVTVPAGKTLGLYPATVGTDFSWTETKTAELSFNVVLGGDKASGKVADFHLWSTKDSFAVTLNGVISGHGIVRASPMRSNAPTGSYTIRGRQTFSGKLVSYKVTNVNFYMGVPEDGVLGYDLELTNINSVKFYSGTDDGAATVTIPSMKASYYNTTIYLSGGQKVVLKELVSASGGLNVVGDGTYFGTTSASKFVLEKNSMAASKIVRYQYVDITLDATTLANNPYAVGDQNGSRFQLRGYKTFASPIAANASLIYGASAATYAVRVFAGQTASFEGVDAGFTHFDVEPGATLTLKSAASALTVNAAAGATVNLYNVSDAATVVAEEGAKVNLGALAEGVAVESSGATVEYVDGAGGWQDSVALWLDASKVETLKALTNASGNVVFQDRGKSCGLSTNCLARAWWYDWRDDQTTYYLYNNRSYNNTNSGAHEYVDVNYVNPWWQPGGGPNGGPCVHFSIVSGYNKTLESDNTQKAGTPSRLEVHRFADADPATTGSIPCQYIYMVYGASAHQKMRGGTSLFYTTGGKGGRIVDEKVGTIETPLFAEGRPYTVRQDGAGEALGSATKLKEGWQILGIATKGDGFYGLGRRDDYVGGGQMYAEVLVLSAVPTLRQKLAIERYLAEKWDLELEAASAVPQKIVANVSGTGTIKAASDVDLEVKAAFRGSVTMSGGSLVLPDGRPIPTEADVPSEGQLAWFDPSVDETLKLAEISDQWVANNPGFEQTNEVCYVYDRVASRRGSDDLTLASSLTKGAVASNANRRVYLLRTAFGAGDVMNWIDLNNYYRELYNDGTGKPYEWGNSFRFWTVGKMNGGPGGDMSVTFKTAFLVQNSLRGGGTPLGDAYVMSAAYKRATTNPADPLWKNGVDTELANGSVFVNGKKVADPLKSAEFTGGPEVLTFQPAGETGFPAKAVGCYEDSQGGTVPGKGERNAIYGEILFYSAQLDAPTCRTVEAYLAYKWFGRELDGFVDWKRFTVSGSGAVTVAAPGRIPTLAEDFAGTVNLTTNELEFAVDSQVSTDRAATGYFATAGGTLKLPSVCTVTIDSPASVRKGSYKLIGWNKLQAGTTFTLANGETVGGKPAMLRVAEDGLYLDLAAAGLLFFVR